jgi:Fe-S-cluster-containing hydrogenase component 2
MAARASLFRTESRWGLYHARVDFPERDDADWFCHAQLKKDEHGRMSSFKRAIEPYIVPIADRDQDAYRRLRIAVPAEPRCRLKRKPPMQIAPIALHPAAVPVTVDAEKCIAHKGCTVCVDVCPLDVLAIDRRARHRVHEVRRVLVLHAVREGLPDRRRARRHPLSASLIARRDSHDHPQTPGRPCAAAA